MRYVLVILLWLCALPVAAAELDYSGFARLPVLEDGRVKPLETLARSLQQRLAGRSDNPTVWLARAVFDPAGAAEEKTFLVRNPHLRAAFELSQQAGHLYSLAELAPGLSRTAEQAEALSRRNPTELTADEQDLLALHTNVLVFNQLLQAFSAVLPLPVTYDGHATWLEAQESERELTESLKGALTGDLSQLSEDQQKLALYLMTLSRLREGGAGNKLLRVIPSGWGDGEWLAPWQVVLSGAASPDALGRLQRWQRLAEAWRAADAASWAKVAAEMHAETGNTRLDLEVMYHAARPYDVAALLLAAGLVLAAYVQRRQKPARSAWLAVLGATLVVSVALMLRVYILARPPVGTLHESLLFVAAVVGIGTLWVTRRTQSLALLSGGAGGMLLLLLIAPAMSGGGESLGMLSAVLNTNFWLTVHVLCITAGYGACILTSVLAHGMLLTYGTRHDMSDKFTLLHRLSLWALLLTATGTLLGGVWADQSWGRFWGWDPKENGALIIVLWLIWLHHGRLAGQFAQTGFITGMALLGVVVAQAWFGVNLLSTGLHSYGFIEGIALGLFSFTAVELVLVIGLYVLARRRQAHVA